MKHFTFAALLLSLSAGVAHGAEPIKGFYVGGSVGNASLELEDADSREDFKADDTGFKLTAGYRILKYLAVEGGYIDYGKPEDRILGVPFEGHFTAVYASAVGMIPLGDFDLFGKAGLAAWEGSLENDRFDFRVSEDNVDPLVGFGAQYRFGRLALRVEFEGMLLGFDDDNDDEADGDDWEYFSSIGATWTF